MISYSDIDIAHKKKSVVKIGRNKVIPRGVVMTIQLMIKFSNKNAPFVISGPIRTKIPDYSSHVKIIGYFH
jgi:hypothetical protein